MLSVNVTETFVPCGSNRDSSAILSIVTNFIWFRPKSDHQSEGDIYCSTDQEDTECADRTSWIGNFLPPCPVISITMRSNMSKVQDIGSVKKFVTKSFIFLIPSLMTHHSTSFFSKVITTSTELSSNQVDRPWKRWNTRLSSWSATVFSAVNNADLLVSILST